MKKDLRLIAKDRGMSSSGFIRMLVNEEINANNDGKPLGEYDLGVPWLVIEREKDGEAFIITVYNEDIDDTVAIEMTLGDLVRQSKVRVMIAVFAKKIMPVIKHAKWTAFLEKLTECREEDVEIPELVAAVKETILACNGDSTMELKEFGTKLLLDAWLDDNFVTTHTRMLFKMSTLIYNVHLVTGVEISKKETGAVFKKLGIKTSVNRFKGSVIRLWSVPISLTKEWRI